MSKEKELNNEYPKIATPTHKLLIKNKGWIEIQNLTEDDKQNVVCLPDEY